MTRAYSDERIYWGADGRRYIVDLYWADGEGYSAEVWRGSSTDAERLGHVSGQSWGYLEALAAGWKVIQGTAAMEREGMPAGIGFWIPR